jgi:hypothetical protein
MAGLGIAMAVGFGCVLVWLARRSGEGGTRSPLDLVRSLLLAVGLLALALLPNFMRNVDHFGYGFMGLMVGVPYLRVLRYALGFDLLLSLATLKTNRGARRALMIDAVGVVGLLLISIPVSNQLGLPYARVLGMDL